MSPALSPSLRNNLRRVSVIVPTKNEAGNILHLLVSLPPQVELVVCDASTDRTTAIVRRRRPRRTRILHAPGTIAEARQTGARASSGDILVFTDADVVFDPGYFQRLLSRPDWDALCGAKLSRSQYARYYRLVARAQSVAYRWFGVAGASGSNMAVTRAAFESLGGFRVALRCNEDTELFLRAGRRGFRAVFDPRLVVWARDHRRLQGGCAWKSAHSLVRNMLLYVTCCRPGLPRLLEGDWGYWTRPASVRQEVE